MLAYLLVLKLPTNLLLVIGALVVLGVVITIAKAKLGRRATSDDADDGRMPYARCALLTAAELSFMRVLELAIDGRYRVFAKVRLADVLDVEDGLSKSGHTTALNRIKSKHLDFVLCDPESVDVVAAIELDDRSHERRDRRDRDEFLQRACEAAGLRLLRLRARHGYSVHELREELGRTGMPLTASR